MPGQVKLKRKDTGNLGEKLAAEFLKKKGYRVLETNYRCRLGEIDIIASQNDSLVFFEVRTRSNLDLGSPEESITFKKMRNMEQTAEYYLQNHENFPDSWRIDVVAVEINADHRLKRIEIIENALDN
jgi:putative endonuclease